MTVPVVDILWLFLLLTSDDCSWAPFPESIVSLSGSWSSSYEHRTVFTPFPEASLVTNTVKTLVANEDSRGTRRTLRASLAYITSVASPADIPSIGCVELKHVQYHGMPNWRNFAAKNSGYRRYITHRLMLDLNSKDRDILEVNNNTIYCSN